MSATRASAAKVDREKCRSTRPGMTERTDAAAWAPPSGTDPVSRDTSPRPRFLSPGACVRRSCEVWTWKAVRGRQLYWMGLAPADNDLILQIEQVFDRQTKVETRWCASNGRAVVRSTCRPRWQRAATKKRPPAAVRLERRQGRSNKIIYLVPAVCGCALWL